MKMKYFFLRPNQRCHIVELALNKGATSRCKVQVLPFLHWHSVHLALLSELNLIGHSSLLPCCLFECHLCNILAIELAAGKM